MTVATTAQESLMSANGREVVLENQLGRAMACRSKIKPDEATDR